tara:strand:- start:1792 stop:2835 length:1044 start_codon:yes stop_codon:yes gene_type:complete
MDQIFNFYKRDKGKVVPVIHTKAQFKKIQKIIDKIIEDNIDLIPKKILKKRKEIKLYQPDGIIDKADSLMINPEEGAFTIKNKLNELTGKEWTKFISSWFIFNAVRSDIKEEKKITEKFNLNADEHPATYSPTMISNFISFFTKSNQKVIDPFAGIGTTLVACDRTKRKGVGIELNKKYFKISQARTKQKVINGNSLDIDKILKKNKVKDIDFCITSPPYWDVLNRSTGDHKKKRNLKNLDVMYSKDNLDLGNVHDYDIFIEKLFMIFKKLKPFLKKNAYLVVILKNVKKGGKNYPLAWDFAKKMTEIFIFKDEKIWCQDKVGLAPYGYPYAYTTNIHHHYCLVFRN